MLVLVSWTIAAAGAISWSRDLFVPDEIDWGHLRPLKIMFGLDPTTDTISVSIVHTLLSSSSFGCIQILELVARSVSHTLISSADSSQEYKGDTMPQIKIKSRAAAPLHQRAGQHSMIKWKVSLCCSLHLSTKQIRHNINNWRFIGCKKKRGQWRHYTGKCIYNVHVYRKQQFPHFIVQRSDP